MDGLDKGKHVNVHRPESVGQGDRLDLPAVDRRHMDAAGVHEPPAESNALRGIVVAADDKDLGSQPGEPHQEIVEQLHRLRRRHGFVVDVPGNQDGIRGFLLNNLYYF